MLQSATQDRDIAKAGFPKQLGGIGRSLVGFAHNDNRPFAQGSKFLDPIGKIAQRNVAGIGDVPKRSSKFFRSTHIDNG